MGTTEDLTQEENEAYIRLNEQDASNMPMSPEEREEYQRLWSKRQDYKQYRDDQISIMREKVIQLGLSPLDIFPHKNLDDALQTGKGDVRKSKDNPVLLRIVSPGKGKKFEYRKGRVYEPANKQTKKPWAMQKRQISHGLLEYGKSRESLLQFATPEGYAYFDTFEGKMELVKLLNFVKQANEHFDGKNIEDEIAEEVGNALEDE